MKKVLIIVMSLICFMNNYSQCPTPSLLVATPSTICAGATTSLNAIALGSYINWYTVPVGGAPCGASLSGANFTINPSVTTTYYAESFDALPPISQTFSYTGAMQEYTVPVGINSMTFEVWGAQGANVPAASVGGLGGYAKGSATVVPGQVFTISVGGQNAFNGGGSSNGGGTGGGASDVRIFPGNLLSRFIVAGGGGGGGALNTLAPGGTGGGGTSGVNYFGGGGGSGANNLPPPTAGSKGGLYGGAGGVGWAVNAGGGGGGGGFLSGGQGGANNGFMSGDPGYFGIGGNANGALGGAGGGGGYYGGGGSSGGNASNAGGGGGSSWTGTLNLPYFQAGIKTGDGLVKLSGQSIICVSPIRQSITVIVNPSPTISVNSGTICSGNSFTIIPSGANTYTIQGGNAIVNPTANVNYTVMGTSTIGCVSQAFATSSINVLNVIPNLSILGNNTICAGYQSASLTAIGADTYSWNTGIITPTIVLSPTVTSSYYIIGTSSVTGCSKTKTVTVLVDDCLGVIDNMPLEIDVSIFPNPSAGEFIIELRNGSSKIIEITDYMGKTIFSIKTYKEITSVNLSSFKAGIYNLKIQGNNFMKVVKILKQ